VTRLSFDLAVAYPKLQFEFVSPVNDQEYDRILGLAQSPFVAGMLKAPDFDNVASAVNAPQPVAGQRQAAPVLQPAEEEEDEEVVVTQHQGRQQAPVFAQPAPEFAAQQTQPATEAVADEWVELDDGEDEINVNTGEIRPKAKALPDMGLDPNVIVTSDGRFFNKATKKFVPSQFRTDAKPNTAQSAGAAVEQAKQEVAAKPKRTRAKAQAELKQVAQPEPEAAPAPQDNGFKANGPAEPMVVAASPKLEALLAGMTPKKS